MKTFLLILGIVSIAALIISLFFAALFLFGYHNVIDGSAGLYTRLHNKMIIGFASGAVFALLAILCFIIRAKM